MKSSKITRRRNELVDLIKEKGRISTQEASDLFHVSAETIRQDFIYLEEKQIIRKKHGGAVLYETDIIHPLAKRQSEHYRAKLAIARKALTFIPETGAIIGMDMGSTVAMLADLLASYANHMIITNSHPVLQKTVESRNRVYALGGEYNPHDMAYQGEQTISSLQKLSLDISFIGTSGVLGRNGICSSDFHDIGVKQEFVRRSRKTIVLTDSSKFQKTSFVEVVNWSEIDVIITDDQIDPEQKKRLHEYADIITVSF